MTKKNKDLGVGQFIAIMGRVFLLTFIGKLLFAFAVGCVSYFGFGSGFDTASFVAIMAYIVPSLIIGTYDLFPKKKTKQTETKSFD